MCISRWNERSTFNFLPFEEGKIFYLSMLDFRCRIGQVQLLPNEVVSLLARLLTLDILQSTGNSHFDDLLFTEKDERWFVHILAILPLFLSDIISFLFHIEVITNAPFNLSRN